MSTKESTKQSKLVNISNLVTTLLWVLLEIAIKAALIMFLWNGFIAAHFTLPAVGFGHAYAIVILVAVLFGNLDGHSKLHTQHLFDLKYLINQLIINQYNQNVKIMSLLDNQSERKNGDQSIDS